MSSLPQAWYTSKNPTASLVDSKRSRHRNKVLGAFTCTFLEPSFKWLPQDGLNTLHKTPEVVCNVFERHWNWNPQLSGDSLLHHFLFYGTVVLESEKLILSL